MSVSKIGPVVNFWVTGYTRQERATVGVSTKFADYYLASPHPAYDKILKKLRQKANKVFLSNVKPN